MRDKGIDLRSDTVTKPTDAMRRAMNMAEVGDDVMGDDPTVNELEHFTAELLKKEAAMFVPSGTMSNQVAIRCHTRPGDEMLLDANAHIYYYEAGGAAALSGVTCRTLPGVRGIFTATDLKSAMRPSDIHFPRTRLLSMENTHNRGGGAIWPIAQMQELCNLASDAGLATHLDGARLWNASAATGIPESEYTRHFDSVSVCFSKGLGAPVGSVLAGEAEFIKEARRCRKQFGGGMRQAGIIAAGALYALKNHRERLVEDHVHAAQLAEGLNQIPDISVNCGGVDTNMVYFDIEGHSAVYLVEQLRVMGVFVLATGSQTIRAVTSMEISTADIEIVVDAVSRIMLHP